MSAVLRVDSVSRRFGDRVVLTSASLRAFAGAVTVLVGRNGAGKSTLLNIAAGRLAPDSGVVHFAGTARLHARHHRLAAAGLFYLPQSGLLSRALPVGVQLDMIRRQFGGRPEADFAWLRPHELLHRKPAQLSAGEVRRAEVLLALAREPACLLADEPFLGLAPRDVELVGAGFRALADAGGAVVISGHEVPALFALATRVTWCTDGTTYELGAPESARTHERFRRDYLGTSMA